MKKYVVHITEILGRNIIIEAEDEIEANSVAEELCSDGTVNLDFADFVDRNVETIGEATNEDLKYLREYSMY